MARVNGDLNRKIPVEVNGRRGRPPNVPDRYLREVNMARAELRKTSLKAVRVLAACLDDEDPKVRVAAAKEVLAKIIPTLQSVQAQIGPIERPVIEWGFAPRDEAETKA